MRFPTDDRRLTGQQAEDMSPSQLTRSRRRTSTTLTILGLLLGAAGIAILWLAGQEFPFYPPPGIVILLAGVVFVGVAPWPWAPVVGSGLGLFVIVGFLLSGFVSGAGFDNLTGVEGGLRSLGTLVQLVGVALALVSGVVATRSAYRPRPARS